MKHLVGIVTSIAVATIAGAGIFLIFKIISLNTFGAVLVGSVAIVIISMIVSLEFFE